jgi:hypothetical protein
MRVEEGIWAATCSAKEDMVVGYVVGGVVVGVGEIEKLTVDEPS